MNKRNTALDGLRGFAAFSVFLAHSGFNIAVLTNIPFFLVAYSALSVGTNAVQILFVLSGFLMAYLYSDETHAFRFIRKRYTRIFPVYIVIITYLLLVSIGIGTIWYEQLFVLLVCAVIFHFVWKMIRKVDNNGKVRTFIFFGFIILQGLLIAGLMISQSHFIRFGQIEYPPILIGLANISLTTDVVLGLTRLLNQAWSLVPEVLFYLTFPFLAIPLINFSKKRGVFIGILLVICMTKIFFDLDTAFYSFADLQSMNIARASGFIAGIVVGTLYKSQGQLWNFIEKIFSNSFIGVLVFLLFLFVQWHVGNAIKNGVSIIDLNLYYLASSWVIALFIAALMSPKTIVSKFFSNKFIAFFGMISYSVYLIHTSMLNIAQSITNLLMPLTTSAFAAVFELFLGLVLTIVVSYLLFRFIESLYFFDKKHIDNKALTKPAETKTSKEKVSRITIISAGIIYALIILILYSGNYASSLIIARNPIIQKKSEVSLTQKPLSIPFTAQYKNLSEIVILFRYVDSSKYTISQIQHHRQLVFQIYDQDKNNLLFESKRDASEVDGQLRFPFGFPIQAKSQNKKYIIKLFLQGPVNGESVYLDTSSTSLVSVYMNSQESKIKKIPSFVLNRIMFAISNQGAQFALGVLAFIILLELLPEKNVIKKQNKSKKS